MFKDRFQSPLKRQLKRLKQALAYLKDIGMSKKRKKADDLDDAAIIDRAKSMAVDWMWAISLQHGRIVNPRPQDQTFNPFGPGFFSETDVHFLIIALRRLRTVATTLEHVTQHWDSVRLAIDKFDKSLPWLRRIRDVFEHLEDYAVDSTSRRSSTSRGELQVWSLKENGMDWLGYDVNWKEALQAAMDLYAAVKAASDSFAEQARQSIDNIQEREPG